MQARIPHASPHTATRLRGTLHRRSRHPDTFPHVTLLILAGISQILSCLLPYVEWDDFHSFINCCKDGRSLFDDLHLRDVILSRYVPWYRHAVSLRDAQNGYRDVAVSLKDVDLLLTSQRIPLHQYPIHARRIITSPRPTEGADAVSSWLRSMTEAHSRFVLLLQAYVHSPDVVQAEPEDMIWMSRYKTPRSPLRKLTFPPPLAYHNVILNEGGAKNSLQSQNGRNVRQNGSARSTYSKKRRPSTYFESSRVPDRSWVRFSMISQLSRDTGYASEDGISMRYPRAISIDSLSYSPSASCSSTVSRNSLNPFATTSSSLGTDPPSPIYPSYPIRMTSPLDLSFAVSRKRAPILRVFVPCSELEDDSHELLLCEQQLIDAGLWDHLSAGDLVCNLGYVPPVEDLAVDTSPAFTSLDDDSSFAPRPRRFSTVLPYYNHLPRSRKWLLFNGEFLVPHNPSDPFSLPDPLSLPTPFYYTHILPPNANPIFIIDRFGLEDTQSTELETSLVHTTIKVPSPHSPAGYALVRKYAWTARVLPLLWNSSQVVRGIGEGWAGEWILEGEGTKEGKETLIDCILGRIAGPLEWEVVVERCGGGRVWLRLLNVLTWTSDTHSSFSIQCL